VAQTASGIAVSHPAPGSDRVATLSVVVGLGAIPLARPAVAEVRAWEAVDSAVVVVEAAVSMEAAADAAAAAGAAAAAAGDKRDVDRERDDEIKIEYSDFAKDYCDRFRGRCCWLRHLAGGTQTEKGL